MQVEMQTALLVRVSSKSDRQDYNRQVDDLTKVCEANNWTITKIIAGKFSATKTRLKDRMDIPELVELVKGNAIQKVLVTGIPRLGRNSREILEIYYFLKDNGVSLYIHQFKLDTGSDNILQQTMNDMFVSIMSSMAEMEVQQLSSRIKSGMERAKKKGVKIGRPIGATDDIAEKIQHSANYKKAATLLRQKTSLRKTAKLADMSVGTASKIKKYLVAINQI